MKTVVELLTEGRALLTPAEARTRLVLARNKKGEAVPPFSDSAVCFCSIGALHRVGGPTTDLDPKYDAVDFLNQAVWELQPLHAGIVNLNDDPKVTHDQILAVWDRALELATSA